LAISQRMCISGLRKTSFIRVDAERGKKEGWKNIKTEIINTNTTAGD